MRCCPHHHLQRRSNTHNFNSYRKTNIYLSNITIIYALQILTCCPFLVFTLTLPPVVLVLQRPLCGTHSHLAFTTLPLPILCAAFLKLRLLIAALPSASHSATMCTLKIDFKLTYLLTMKFCYFRILLLGVES